jgi:hypothetical protein
VQINFLNHIIYNLSLFKVTKKLKKRRGHVSNPGIGLLIPEWFLELLSIPVPVPKPKQTYTRNLKKRMQMYALSLSDLSDPQFFSIFKLKKIVFFCAMF